MENNHYLAYEAPLVEIVEVEVEKGFETTDTTGLPDFENVPL
jgi:hypothetical protein